MAPEGLFGATLLLLVALVCYARPTDKPQRNPFPHSLHTYLMNFGYLSKGNPNALSSRSDTELRRAVMRLQSFAGIAPTGELDAETAKLLRRKRCGVPDLTTTGNGRTRRYVIQGLKWPRHNLTYRVVNGTTDLDFGRVRRAIFDALKVWTSVANLTITETQEPKADLSIQFNKRDHADGFPFDGPNVVLAHAFFPGEGLGGDVHFDDDELWTDGEEAYESGTTNLFGVAAHEFGHSMGLAHSDVSGSLMYPYHSYRGFSNNYQLPYDDIMGIQKLYGNGGKVIPSPDPETTTFQTDRVVTTELPRPTATPSAPQPCDSNVDAVATIRNEIFVFKARYFWRYDQHGSLLEKPSLITDFWSGLPQDLAHIDAVYEKPNKATIVFFIGDLFWEFKENFALPGFPRHLSQLGLPAKLTKVDAAFIWGYNLKTYFFAGGEYWRYDQAVMKTEVDYPRRMDLWKGIPYHIDAAFTAQDGVTYFFKNASVFRFNNMFMRVEKGWPKPVKQFWTHCGGQLHLRAADSVRLPNVGAATSDAAAMVISQFVTAVKTLLVAFSAALLCCL